MTTGAAKELAATERKKKEPTKSSGSPLKDKSNDHHNSKGTTMEAEMGTKLHSLIHTTKLIRTLKQTVKELAGTKKAAEEKDERIIKLEQELVEQQRKNAKLTAALKQANTMVEEREAIIIKLERNWQRHNKGMPPR